MIEIKCADNDTAVKLCERVGVAAQTVLTMTEREELLGFACMTQNGEEVTLLHVEAPDSPLTDALLRAALNAARANGAKNAAIAHESLRAHMVKKGYDFDLEPNGVKIANFFAKSVCKA